MNNNLDSLIKTLGSISFQNYKDLNIYIVNNTKIDLDDKLDMFKDLKINIIKCSSSNLKNYGLNCGNSPYILFINSGDLLYNCFSISNILVDCDKYDLVAGRTAICYADKVDFYDDLSRYTYGKLFSREFIEKNHLKFIYSKYFSEMAFYKLYLMCKPRAGLCNMDIYFTYNGIEDDNKKEYIIDYCKNINKDYELA